MNAQTGIKNKSFGTGTIPFVGNEKLLQFIWQFQYFNPSELYAVKGEKIEIVTPGKINFNQGPDFLEAQIKIDDTLFAGSVELHLQTSNWEEHCHSTDSNYNNVILHVVFEHDADIPSNIPVLELQQRIAKLLIERYNGLMQAPELIACSNSISDIKDILWTGWKERLIAERLLRKAKIIFNFNEQNQYHWEETFWWMLARNFGTKVNSDAFETVARSLPLTVIGKHKHQLISVEALLLGQAGLLNNKFREDYPKMLQREYRFLKKKYNLQPIHIPVHFLRMRPGNFPTIRLAQLSALINNSAHLFSIILETGTIDSLKKIFDVTANDYWHYHYVIDELSAFKKKILGKDMIDNVIINTIVPVLFAYGSYHKEEKYKQKALEWLEKISPESNTITKGFSELNVSNKNAFDSQALIELKTQYCDQKHCLKCVIGNAILKTADHLTGRHFL
jgi:hypothetical protein